MVADIEMRLLFDSEHTKRSDPFSAKKKSLMVMWLVCDDRKGDVVDVRRKAVDDDIAQETRCPLLLSWIHKMGHSIRVNPSLNDP